MQFFVFHMISKLLVILKKNGEKYEGIPLNILEVNHFKELVHRIKKIRSLLIVFPYTKNSFFFIKGISSYFFLFLKKIVHDPTRNKSYYLIV